MKILVAGGAGYIGSHTCVALLEAGYEVVCADNLSNSSKDAISRVEKITNKSLPFYRVNLCDESATEKVFMEHSFDCVIHFAGLKAVPESVAMPVAYYNNNLNSTLNLCKMMKKYGVKRFIFSSSATVYKNGNEMPLVETMDLGCTNPYGWTKFMCEQILRDVCAAEKDWSVVLLRYFNPVGAHESGIIGEDPNGIPNNLMPRIVQALDGRLKNFTVTGDDYDTPDGTGVRDYIHVLDLVDGHVKAVDYAAKNTGCEAFNLGTGRGFSVLELINTFERVNGVKVPYSIAARRPGDIATCYADSSKAAKALGFKAEKTLEDMCRDTWRFSNGK
ncbi:MAG: UDP-glucose 4-epimerase GalE [Defluviitaleaceae bacterium]|nr:UDP-glucose 4-epimerase GalE [Defluviitaleaceae bacterium]